MSSVSLKSAQGMLLVACAAVIVFFVPTPWLVWAGLVSVGVLMFLTVARFVFGSWAE